MTHELLQQLEAAHRGELTENDRAELDAALRALPEGGADAAAYQQLWAAFDALRLAQVRDSFAATEQQLRTHDDQELAIWYAEGQLHPDNHRAVAQRMATDADFSDLVHRQTKLTDGFAALQAAEIKAKMKTWDAAAAPTTAVVRPLASRTRRWWVVAATVLLLVLAGGYLYQSTQNNGPALAAQYYKQVATGNTLGNEADTRTVWLQSFDEAHGYFQQGDYPAAAAVFTLLADTFDPDDWSPDDAKYYADNIAWNTLLAQLAAGQTDESWHQRLSQIAGDTTHSYQKSAAQLRDDVGGK